jgi:hypothetical protein
MTDPNALPASAPALPQFGPGLRKLYPHADMHIPRLTVAKIEQAPALLAKSGISTEMDIANMRLAVRRPVQASRRIYPRCAGEHSNLCAGFFRPRPRARQWCRL